jgi:CHASE3 domain sensor protein
MNLHIMLWTRIAKKLFFKLIFMALIFSFFVLFSYQTAIIVTEKYNWEQFINDVRFLTKKENNRDNICEQSFD